ncbi:hypothetical protein ACLBW0_09205 [Enterobacteriaceae bacterium C34A]
MIADSESIKSHISFMRGLAGLAFLLFSSFLHAALPVCNKYSHRLNQQIMALDSQPESAAVHFSKATSYISAGCYKDADNELVINLAMGQDEPDKAALKNQLINNAKALKHYVELMQTLESGQREEVIAGLFDLMGNNLSTAVMWYTTMSLSELLLENSTPEQWQKIESKLRSLNRNDRFWQADRYIGLKLVQQGKADLAINQLRDKLSETQTLQRGYERQAVLTEILVADNRMLNARVFCMETNRAVGENLLDSDLRLIYLKSCQKAWKAAPDDDPNARYISRIFDRAVIEYIKQF